LDGTAVDTEVGWSALLDVIADAGGLDDVAAISIPGQPHGMAVLDPVPDHTASLTCRNAA
jgi:xylulokinase